MATHTTSTAVGEREQLADVIYRIDPTETPLFSNLKIYSFGLSFEKTL